MRHLLSLFAGPIISDFEVTKSTQIGKTIAIIAVILAFIWLFLFDKSYSDDKQKRVMYLVLASVIIPALGYGLFLLATFFSIVFI